MPDIYQQLVADPANFFEADYYAGYTLTPKQLEDIHLAGVRRRFKELRGQIGALDALASEQKIDEIDSIDRLVPLLFPHTVYKSYPLSFLERARFDRLTKWLDGLTTVDLSGVDATGVETIDDWVALLMRTTELQPNHTFGTTGKLSFIPRVKRHWEKMARLTAHTLRDWNGSNTGPDLLAHHMPAILPTYRRGAGAINHGMDWMVKLYAGSDDNALFLYPDTYFSADVASLGGRLRAAEARGEQGQLEISPALLAKRDQFAAQERDRPQALERFFAQALERFGGKDVYMFAVWPILFEWAEAGLARGLRNCFGPNSVLTTGGGSKGKKMPDNWKQQIFEFLGFERYYEVFGMSELMTNCPRCSEGNFHFPPVLVPFVLDPDNGQPLPRKDNTTGRLAIFDTLADTYWGGFITGDEVTMSGWEKPCACGRHGPYMHPLIRRFSDKTGTDDKINCAGAPEAHDRAVDYLVSQSQ
jgi:hypothetical protein